MKTKTLFTLILILAVIMSCSKKDDENKDNNNNTTPTAELGEVGNQWEANFNEDNTKQIRAEIINNANGMVDVVFHHDGMTDSLKMQVTDNAVYEYVHSDGDLTKPYTMVEFDAEIGDIYTYESKGFVLQREVVDLNPYPVLCLGLTLPLIGVYEFFPSYIGLQIFGYTIAGIWWYWHHLYGLVCVEVTTEQGDFFVIEFVSIDL